jgi:tRNA(Ile2) C34 agmatinyltransferase TiaS
MSMGWYHLDMVTLNYKDKPATICRPCGAGRGQSWRCDYCHTTYPDAPRYFGFPISNDEMRGIIEGNPPDVDMLIATRAI